MGRIDDGYSSASIESSQSGFRGGHGPLEQPKRCCGEITAEIDRGFAPEQSDGSLSELVDSGLIEKSEGWQPTQAGRSAYVIRDEPHEYVLPLRRRWSVSADANRALFTPGSAEREPI
jgi:hypothetical protein